MSSGDEGYRYTLREELSQFLSYGPQPIPDRIIEAVARRDSVTPEVIREHFVVLDQLMNSIASYLGKSPEDDGDLRILAAKFEAEFLLNPGDFDKLHSLHLLLILVYRQRKLADPSFGKVRDIDAALASFVELDELRDLEPESLEITLTCYRKMLRVVHANTGPRSLRHELREHAKIGQWPPNHDFVDQVASENRVSREQALNSLQLVEDLASALAVYMGRPIETEADRQMAFGRISIDFNLLPADADRMHPIHLTSLLTHHQRILAGNRWYVEVAPDELFKEIVHIDGLRDKEPDSSKLFITSYWMMCHQARGKLGNQGINHVHRGTVATLEKNHETHAAFTMTPAEMMKKDHPGRGVPIAFLKFMEVRESATYDEIAMHVHGDAKAKEPTIRQNVTKINEYLRSKELAVTFKCESGRVVKILS